jgi:hypothetical protein
MGRIDPAPPRPGRGLGSPAGWIVAGALAIALAALMAFQAGKRSGPGASSAIHEPSGPAGSPAPSVRPPASTFASAPTAATVDHVSSPSPPEQRLESAVMEVTIPRPAAQAPAALTEEPPLPTPAPETLHETMARCLSFRVEDDEIRDSNPFTTRVRVMVTNRCDFSFPGSEVWFEVRAVPLHSGGTSAREFGRFYAPIEARAGDETALVLACPRCYAVTHRLEAGLSWPPADGRQ